MIEISKSSASKEWTVTISSVDSDSYTETPVPIPITLNELKRRLTGQYDRLPTEYTFFFAKITFVYQDVDGEGNLVWGQLVDEISNYHSDANKLLDKVLGNRIPDFVFVDHRFYDEFIFELQFETQKYEMFQIISQKPLF